jgi:hypothetical protein
VTEEGKKKGMEGRKEGRKEGQKPSHSFMVKLQRRDAVKVERFQQLETKGLVN